MSKRKAEIKKKKVVLHKPRFDVRMKTSKTKFDTNAATVALAQWNEISGHIEDKISELSSRDTELLVLLDKLNQHWDGIAYLRGFTEKIVDRKILTREDAEKFDRQYKAIISAKKELQDCVQYSLEGSHRDRTAVLETLGATLGVSHKKKGGRIPVPHLYIGVAALTLMENALELKKPLPTLSDIRAKAAEILKHKFRGCDYALLTEAQWRISREYFEFGKFFPDSRFGAKKQSDICVNIPESLPSSKKQLVPAVPLVAAKNSVDLSVLKNSKYSQKSRPSQSVEKQFLMACCAGHRAQMQNLIMDHRDLDIHAFQEAPFRFACSNGHLNAAKFLISIEDSKGETDIHVDHESAFRNACKYGHLQVAQWLLSLSDSHKPVDIHALNDDSFFSACSELRFDVAEWLLTLESGDKKIEIHRDNELLFRRACTNGRLSLARQLIDREDTHGKVNIHANNDEAFSGACTRGDLELAKWLIGLERNHGVINIHALHEKAFLQSCENGHLFTIKYILSLERSHGKINIHEDEDFAFRRACFRGRLDIAQLLIDVNKTHKPRIDIHAKNDEALQQASEIGDIGVIKFLLSLGESYGRFSAKTIESALRAALEKSDIKKQTQADVLA